MGDKPITLSPAMRDEAMDMSTPNEDTYLMDYCTTKTDDVKFERWDGGHCYLRVIVRNKLFDIERMPSRLKIEDINALNAWAIGSRAR